MKAPKLPQDCDSEFLLANVAIERSYGPIYDRQPDAKRVYFACTPPAGSLGWRPRHAG